MVLVYNLFIKLYVFAIRIAALRRGKAKGWLEGRKHLFEDLEKKINPSEKWVWVHCASAGELEQGKPVIEALKKQYPSFKVLVTFFSPSGYAAGRKYDQADLISYLPVDTAAHAKKFMQLVRPQLAIFIKYEYWYHHLSAAAFYHVPVLLVSSIFRENQVFFKWYGKFYRQILFLFNQLFVQDAKSRDLLQKQGIRHVTIAGDTRFDRVARITEAFRAIEVLEAFASGRKLLVAGSTWPDDEQLLARAFEKTQWALVVAPHEINEAHLHSIKKTFPDCFFYSEISNSIYEKADVKTSVWNSIDEQQTRDIQKKLSNARVLIVDQYGMLSKLYHYANITYVGGGFNSSGIHNTLEAAVWGKPVFFGPNYQKFREARDLIANGAAFSVREPGMLESRISSLTENQQDLERAGDAARKYVETNRGATDRVLQFIQEKRLLTSS